MGEKSWPSAQHYRGGEKKQRMARQAFVWSLLQAVNQFEPAHAVEEKCFARDSNISKFPP